MENYLPLILFLILTVALFILIGRLNRKQFQRAQEYLAMDPGFDSAIRRAITTDATVIDEETQIQPNAGGYAKVDLTMEIQLPGKDVYRVTTCWLVKEDSLDFIKPGSRVQVKVDARKPKRVVPIVPWAATWVFGK